MPLFFGGERGQGRIEHGETLPVRLRSRSAAGSADPPPAPEQELAPEESAEAPPTTGDAEAPPTTGDAEAPPTTGVAEVTSMDPTDQQGWWTSRPWSSWLPPAQGEAAESHWRAWSWEASSPGWWS